jgi:ABC-type nickel/cobalt efflux system permease component RcnA
MKRIAAILILTVTPVLLWQPTAAAQTDARASSYARHHQKRHSKVHRHHHKVTKHHVQR